MPFLVPHLDSVQAIAKRKKIKIFLVGGFLRDYLLNRPCVDFDFTLKQGAISFARVFARKIKGAFVLLDQEHGCARVVRKEGGRILIFDFADFRDKTLLGDLSHRDFTINTLCVDIAQLKQKEDVPDILLGTKKAKADIKNKTIRMVSRTSFQEDPLRLLRAFSLQALLGFKIEKKTLLKIKKEKGLLKGTSFERIRDEIFKVLETDKAAENIRQMDKAGIFEKIIPQISVMFPCTQGGYHHLDVWPHSLEALFQLEGVLKEFRTIPEIRAYLDEPLAGARTRQGLLKLAALLHDIGKPETKKIENGRTSFHGHEHVGKGIVRHIAKMLKLSTREQYTLEGMVLWHLRPGYLSNFKSPSQRAIFRYFRDTKEEAVSILLLSLADQRATRGPLTSAYDQKHHEDIVKRLVGSYLDKGKEKPFVRLIGGHDLIRKLKLTPSPLFSKILAAVEEQQAMGKIAAKQEALAFARQMAAS